MTGAMHLYTNEVKTGFVKENLFFSNWEAIGKENNGCY